MLSLKLELPALRRSPKFGQVVKSGFCSYHEYGIGGEQEIRSLTRKMKGYAGQERRLMSVLRLEVATPDIVLDELNQMKKEREVDEKRLNSLTQTKENFDNMIDLESNLKELCAGIVSDLDSCTNQDKKDAYTYLDLKVKATPEGADIKGYLDSSMVSPNSYVLTTGQTSGCLCFYRNICC